VAKKSRKKPAKKKPVMETPKQRAASERRFAAWLKKEAAERQWSPKDANLLPEEDVEGPNE
jgi:hypothetical protein